jgi:hypothetical protein
VKIDNVDEVKELLVDIDILFSNLDDIKKELEEKIRQKEAEQEDYLHEIELGNLNGIQLTGVAKQLKQTRKERRAFKDKLDLINTLKGYTDKYITKGIIGDTKQAIKNIEMLESNHKTREYVPRIIKNLRCAKKRKGDE